MQIQVNSKGVANCESPKCAASDFVKVHRRPDEVKTIKNNLIRDKDLKKYLLLPGHMVSMDHYISRAPVSIYHTRVNSDP